ncbi:MAG: hypothetical protein ACUVYA_00115 [Planctomycetota bacterium]
MDPDGDAVMTAPRSSYPRGDAAAMDPPPALGTDCVRIEGCPDACS